MYRSQIARTGRVALVATLVLLSVSVVPALPLRQAVRAVPAFPPELVDWAPYEGNPLFAGTGRDTWDREIRERGFILREGDAWRLWYTGYDTTRSETKSLGYATSPDGLRWSRYPANPVFDGVWTEDVFVVKHEGVYHMFAEGVKYPGNPIIRSDDSSGILVDDGQRLRLYTMHPAVRLWLPRGAPALR